MVLNASPVKGLNVMNVGVCVFVCLQRKSKRRQSAKTQEAGAKRAKLNEEIQSESEE